MEKSEQAPSPESRDIEWANDVLMLILDRRGKRLSVTDADALFRNAKLLFEMRKNNGEKNATLAQAVLDKFDNQSRESASADSRDFKDLYFEAAALFAKLNRGLPGRHQFYPRSTKIGFNMELAAGGFSQIPVTNAIDFVRLVLARLRGIDARFGSPLPRKIVFFLGANGIESGNLSCVTRNGLIKITGKQGGSHRLEAIFTSPEQAAAALRR